MIVRRHSLVPPAPGSRREFVSLHYGAGGGRKAVIQASLHADEVPAMLVAHHLRRALDALDASGRVRGEVVLVPYANPIGLAQQFLRGHVGRFDLATGENFNRHYADLAATVASKVAGTLSGDAAADVDRVRAAARAACASLDAHDELTSLRRALLGLAIDADLVLDLHSDNEALMHLYTATPVWPEVEPLARLLGAEVSLLATTSGDEPFDESCSMLWPRVREKLAADAAAAALPDACVAVTVELRGESDVEHELAQQDAQAILGYLAHQGFLDEASRPAELPPLRRGPLPLAGSMPVVAPAGGVLVYRAALGAELRAGDPLADLVDPDGGDVIVVPSPADGVFYARELRRLAHAGQKIAKVAGRVAVRTGKLLSA